MSSRQHQGSQRLSALRRILAYCICGALSTNGLAQSLTSLTTATEKAQATQSADPRVVANLTDIPVYTEVTNATAHVYPANGSLRASLDLDIAGPATGAGPEFVNVLVDLDGDGALNVDSVPSSQQWPVRNVPVLIADNGITTLRTAPFLSADSPRVFRESTWLRVVVSPTPIEVAVEAAVESEQIESLGGHLVDIDLNWPQRDGEQMPVVTMTCPERVDFAGAPVVELSCQWRTLTSDTLSAVYSLAEVTGQTLINNELDVNGDVYFSDELVRGHFSGQACGICWA